MRGKWIHAPAVTQPCPPDTTNACVLAQVTLWQGTEQREHGGYPDDAGTLVHPEVAIEIAAWWRAPGNDFALFSAHGRISPDLVRDILDTLALYERGLIRPEPDTGDTAANLAALRALLAYVRACDTSPRPPQREPLSVPAVLALAEIARAAAAGRKVARLMPSGDVVVGVARSVGDARGNFADAGDDIRDMRLRVTTLAGWEAFWPVAELVAELHDTTFSADYDDGGR